jgi:hypothetical protein
MNRYATALCAALVVFVTVGAAWATSLYPGYTCTPLATFPTNIYGTTVNSYGETLLSNGTVIGMAEYQAPIGTSFPQTELITWKSNGSMASAVDYGIWGNVYNTMGDGSVLALNGESKFYIYSGGTATSVPQLAGGGLVVGGMSPSGLVGGYGGNGGFVYDAVSSQYYAVGGDDGWVQNVGNGCAVGGYWNGTATVGLLWTETNQATSYIPSLSVAQAISSNNTLLAGVNPAGTAAAVYNTATQTTTTYFTGEATGVNDSGLVIGDNQEMISTNTSGIYTGRAMAYINGQTVDLTTAYAPSGVTFNMAVAVNDAGQILVWSQGDQDAYTGTTSYLLTPVPTPEPSTLLLCATGLLGLLAYAWRKHK